MKLSPELEILLFGIAGGLAFIGIFGALIDPGNLKVSVGLIVLASSIALTVRNLPYDN